MTFELASIALVVFIGMGPVKVAAEYVSVTRQAPIGLRREIALRAVAQAAAIALVLLVVGAALQALLHVSGGGLVVGGAIVLLAYGLRMALGLDDAVDVEGPLSDADLRRRALFPLAFPLILNPAGVAAMIIISVEATSVAAIVAAFAIVVAIAAIDLVVLLVLARVGHRLSEDAVAVASRILGILLVALAIDLVALGLAEMGVIEQIELH
jgi:multiple antibiotic resistance protein